MQEQTPHAETTFALDRVTFRVPGRTLLHPLSLTFPTGKVTGLIGHNGSGKSTLLKMLGRHQPPSAGDVLLDGQPLESWGSKAFARKVAYLPQQLPPAEGMTVRELVAIGRYPWHGALGRFGAADREKVEEAIALVGLKPLAHRLVDSLSGGERQRAWIAMLVAQDSRCLLLDEPTSALDIAHQVDVLALVRETLAELTPWVLKQGLELDLEAGEGDYHLNADPGSLGIALQNLVTNAVNHSPAGGRLHVRLSADAQRLLLQVEDQGPGIPAEDLERVFERFYSRGTVQGAGLGLAIVQSIARRHAGQIRLRNLDSGGLQASLELPRSA